MEKIKVGVVGAGPWAHLVHGPMLAAGPETELTAVWARRPEAAAEMAAAFGGKVCPDFESLLGECDAVAFSVPPAVQADLALRAARAGKHLILEKPIADTLDNAERLTDAIDKAGVASIVTLSYRYAPGVRDFIAANAGKTFRGGRAIFLTNAYLGGPFATEWRLKGGSIVDIGPHAIDLLEQIVGPVIRVDARHGPGEWTAVTLDHANGAVTQVSLCSHTATDPLRFELDLYNESETRTLDVISAMGKLFGDALLGGRVAIGSSDAFTNLRREFAEAVRTGAQHPLNAHHGLHVQKLIAQAVESLGKRSAQ